MIVIEENEPSDEAIKNMVSYLFELIDKYNIYDEVKKTS